MDIRRQFILAALILLIATAGHAQMILIDNGQTDYRIVLPSNSDSLETFAAKEFQLYLEKITGTRVPIVVSSEAPTPHEIVIGNSERLTLHRIKAIFNDDERDGFLIKVKDDKLFIAGGSPAGTLNGVYSFLENYLGCRYYGKDAFHVPRMNRISIGKINDRQVPVFSYRETHFPGKYDPQYLAWHKLHTHQAGGEWGMWVHTFDDLIPPKTYYEDHPEYFSEINGKRMPNGQLCLSNPEMFDVLVANLQKKMNSQPGARYWSVSQNDNFLACQCADCKKIAAEYGGESGLMIWFVNRVAELFPEKIISTLAYQYTRSAPSNIRPLPNVNIMLCTIECNRSIPIAEDPSSASFVKDIKDWTKLTQNILIWDYVVQFRNYISPFPNLRVLQPNLEFFAKYGCEMMFQQGSGNSLSEFSDLRTYIIAKLLWNPDADAKEIMNDFIYGYYGDAAPYISEYIEMLHDFLEASGDNLWIYGYPFDGFDSYLTPANISVYKDIFDKAEALVMHNPVLLDRVQYARLPLDFAVLDMSLHEADNTLSWFLNSGDEIKINDEMVALLDTFTVRCNRLGVKVLNEQGLTPEAYRLKIKEFLIKIADRHLGINKSVEIFTEFSPKYDAGGAKALTDGLRGIDDYHFNWLGFEGKDLEAMIDLGSVQTINEVSAGFIQDIQAWIFLPQKFTVMVSEDGDEFLKMGTVENITPSNKTGVFIQEFSLPAENLKARYIRVRAESLKTCPSWHIGAGKNCWIFTDEIVIK